MRYLIPQGAAKLPEVKVGDVKKNPGLKPGPQVHGSNQAEWQIFFQTFNFDIWHFCSLLSYKDRIISFESPNIEAIGFNLKKSLTAIFFYNAPFKSYILISPLIGLFAAYLVLKLKK